MKITPEQLEAEGFQLLESLNHEELLPFVQEAIRKQNVSSSCYYAANVTAVSATTATIVFGLISETLTVADGVIHFSMAFLFVALLLPLHEVLHAFAYWLLGARKTSFDVNLKKLYFMALADKFVASRIELMFVALLPFAVISVSLVTIAFCVPITWAITVLVTLSLHTSMCCGDFAMLSFFEHHHDKLVVTYDDVSTRTSYFFARQSN